MILTPLLAVHTTVAIVATVIGPFAIWARLGMTKHPKLHRAFGYAWVTLMIITAISAIFIPSSLRLNWHGFSLIHALVPVTMASLFFAFHFLIKGNIKRHKRILIILYIQACLIAGAFAVFQGPLMRELLWK